MNGSIIELPSLASELGLSPNTTPAKPPAIPATPARPTFSYRVNAFSLITGAVDTTGSATFTPFNPAVSSGDFASLSVGASTTIQLTDGDVPQPNTRAPGRLVDA